MHEHELIEARRILHHHAAPFRAERSCLADLLLSVGEFEERGLHRALGYATIFDYLHRALSMSKGMSHYRMVGARLMRKFPEVEEPVRDGRLCLTTVVELARVMTEKNGREVLPKFFGLSREEARQLAAAMDPAAVVPRTTIVSAAVPAKSSAPVQESGGASGSTVELDPTRPEGVKAAPEATRKGVEAASLSQPRIEAGRPTVDPLTATESRLHMTASREFLSLLKKAKAGESHRNPGATDEQVLKLALDALLEKQAKRKACVPAQVKREVVRRDGGKCRWPAQDGGICGATVRLEIDHVVPRGKGGPSTVDNCRVLCKPHNLQAAREAYGDAHMDLFARGGSTNGDSTTGEEVAEYGPARRGARRRNPIARPCGGGVGCGPCSGRKPRRSGSSACASRCSSSLVPASSSSTTTVRPWACRSAGERGTTWGRCTWG